MMLQIRQKRRRKMIVDRCENENIELVFVEFICNDQKMINKNVLETKLTSPDYKDVNPELAVEDFRKRIGEYEKSYESLGSDESHYSYVQLIDVGRQIRANKIESYLASRIVHFLMNLHVTTRPIWLTRHGESEYNTEGRLGGDSGLTAKGDEYAHALADWVQVNLTGNLTIWTSSELSDIYSTVH
eukprot:TRINITY_DN3016_c0_g1_i1.p2 TRINITY_DN3016_c0_g1~~TRINITY_DN3016_c0_g1_i1.p2  ORF type:complete len:186 (-),score=46.18 TRINITY_DN3016_c0_g1_i1:413-970(-)